MLCSTIAIASASLVLHAVALDTASFDRVHVPGIGIVRGRSDHAQRVTIFSGLRFAESPEKDRRWRPPRKMSRYSLNSAGEVDATKFGPSCPQVVDGSIVGDEDCLFLNIFRPNKEISNTSFWPVLFWLHGGSFVKGSTNIFANETWGPLYDGRALAARSAVVVTSQYRLGILGFLGGEELRERDLRRSTGNYGMQDQRMALDWVHRHIAAFGGNPTKIMLFGQSAGACSVQHHLVSQASHNLFATAALESGAGCDWCSQRMDNADATLTMLKMHMKCHNATCLVNASMHALLLASVQVPLFAPVVDGVDLLDDPMQLIASGKVKKSPTIVGFVRDESSGLSITSEKGFEEYLLATGVSQSAMPTVKAWYNEAHSEWYWMAVGFGTDMGVGCSAQRFAHAMTNAGASVFAYKFSKQPSFPVELLYGASASKLPRQRWGAYHGAELAFVFGNTNIPAYSAQLNAVEVLLAARVGAHWLSLAANATPLSSWPQLRSKVRGDSVGSSKWLLLDAPDVVVEESSVLQHCTSLTSFVHGLQGSRAVIV